MNGSAASERIHPRFGRSAPIISRVPIAGMLSRKYSYKSHRAILREAKNLAAPIFAAVMIIFSRMQQNHAAKGCRARPFDTARAARRLRVTCMSANLLMDAMLE